MMTHQHGALLFPFCAAKQEGGRSPFPREPVHCRRNVEAAALHKRAPSPFLPFPGPLFPLANTCLDLVVTAVLLESGARSG